jgi:hypothetical protein
MNYSVMSLNHLDGAYVTAGDIGMIDTDLVELKKYSSHVCSTKGNDSGSKYSLWSV